MKVVRKYKGERGKKYQHWKGKCHKLLEGSELGGVWTEEGRLLLLWFSDKQLLFKFLADH